jgi:hypothetical protein
MVSIILTLAALAAAPSGETGGAVRAEARATILQGVTIGANTVRKQAEGPRTAATLPPPRSRACDPTPAQSSPSCRLIVYDLP